MVQPRSRRLSPGDYTLPRGGRYTFGDVDRFALPSHLSGADRRAPPPSSAASRRAPASRRVITIGTNVPDHGAVLKLISEHPTVFAALGIHPHYAAEVEPRL